MELSRRNFLKGAAATASVASLGVLSAAEMAHAEEAGDVEESNGAEESNSEASAITYDQTIQWNGQYDVIVIGFGAAGASSAIAASDAGANVLIVEKAPLGEEGGNSRLCAQMFVNGQGDVEEVRSYYEQLAGEFELPDDILDFWAEGVANIASTYASVLDLDENDFVTLHDTPNPVAPEYEEFVTNDSIAISYLHDGSSDAYMWNNYRQQVVNRAESIDVWLESPAIDLIQEPNTKTVLGVRVSRGGEELNIRATNGVVMCAGGFENNRTMLEDYLGLASSGFAGTSYNTGDGINMAKAAGADLWHMHSYEANGGYMGCLGYMCEDGERTENLSLPSDSYAYVIVGGDGYRYLNEAAGLRHGHLYNNGTWDSPVYPSRSFVVFDDTVNSLIEALDSYGAEYVQADSITELAELIGTKEGVLEQTIADYNFFAENGYDYQYYRDAEQLQAFGDGPYYAAELEVAMLNTQGGPRRNANAEIVDVDGNAIPHLYGAGECGGITSHMYQSGGNMAECLLFGQLAGKNAAAEKDSLDTYVAEAVESDLAYTIGVVNDILEGTTVEDYEAECADNEYIGSATGIGGDIIVKVTTDDGTTIIDLVVLEEYETEDKGGVALEELVPAIIEAGTTDGVDAVSGATVTSEALFEAIAEALAKAAE